MSQSTADSGAPESTSTTCATLPCSADSLDRSTFSSSTRRWIIGLLFLITVGLQLWRIGHVRSNTGETPFLSANDRSRWCTILALSAKGSYEIDDIVQMRDERTNRRTWYTIDMVQHRAADGQQHFYSSKPPLLPTLYTGVYWCVRQITGFGLLNHPFQVAQILLVIVNLIPMIGLWWLMIYWLQQKNLDGFSFVAMLVLALMGTFLTTFVVTLNNHTPAAIAVAFSLWAVERIAIQHDTRARWFILAGLCTSFTTANEMPALSWLVIVAVILSRIDLRKAAMFYLPALLPVTLGFFVTNYLAHGTWRPAYSQRAVGSAIGALDTQTPEDLAEIPLTPVIDFLKPQGIQLSEKAIIRKARREGIWELWDEETQWRIALRKDGENKLGVYHWGDWYDYPGSYWVDGKKQGVDKGEPSILIYTFHCLFGHHGIFSLTPMWLISLCAAGLVLAKRPLKSWTSDFSRLIPLAIVVTSLVVIAFYLTRPLEDRNYGGVCSGLRWAFWLIPLWYWLALQGFCCGKQVWARAAIVGMLVVSLISANYPWINPWTSPWPTRILPHQAQEY